MLSPPVDFGPYKLIEPIGQGGMAQVFRMQWIGPDNMVGPRACKIMRPEVAKIPNLQEMFLEEARLSMLLSDINICTVHSAGADPVLHIVMEWINGMTLAQISNRMALTKTPLDFGSIAYIVAALLRGLRTAHQFFKDGQPFPIIHRDVSPQNVMVSVRGEVKLMDFGIAKALAQGTGPADCAGKLRYLPREQLYGKVGPQTDLYSTGAVLHELIEGVLFRADCGSEAEMIGAIESGHVPVLTRPGVPQPLRALHQALLQPDPSKRPQTANAALAILGKVMVEQDALAQIVCSLLGPRSTVSGSTISDFVVPAEVASAVPHDHQDSCSPEEPASDREGAHEHEEGQIFARTPTVVVSPPRRTVAGDLRDDVSRPAVLVPRGWASARAVPVHSEACDEQAEASADARCSSPQTEEEAMRVELAAEGEVTRVRTETRGEPLKSAAEDSTTNTMINSELLLPVSSDIEVRLLGGGKWQEIVAGFKLSVVPRHYRFQWRRNGETTWNYGGKHTVMPRQTYTLTATENKLVVGAVANLKVD